MMYRLVLISTIILNVCTSIKAQVFNDTVQIYFKQSKVDIDTTYMNNASVLFNYKQLTSLDTINTPNFMLTKVVVQGGASPEGSVNFNEWLSHQRAYRFFRYLNSDNLLSDSIKSYRFIGRDWNGLYNEVYNDLEVPYREDVLNLLEIIRENTKNGETESQKNLLKIKALHKGIPYRYMYRKLFPKLRESKVIFTYSIISKPLGAVPIEYTLYSYNQQCPILDFGNSQKDFRKPLYIGLKSNLLYDIIAIPEFGAEFYLGNNISIVGNWFYGWWDTDKRHRYWRAYGGDLAARYWLGDEAHTKPLTGHHLGLYAGVLTYDFELGGRGYMGGRPGHSLWDRCNYNFGVEYGYALPVGKRLNIDFTIGLGYLGGKYLEYIPVDKCYVWQCTKYRHFFGPTKTEISLVWLIGHNNFNQKKGVVK